MAGRESLFVLLAGALLVVVTAVLLYLLLPACGARPLFGGWLPSFCPATANAGGVEAGLRDAAARARALEDEIRRLELELIEASRCPEPGPVGPRLTRPADPPPFVPLPPGEMPASEPPLAPPRDTAELPAEELPAAEREEPPAEPPGLDEERWEEQDIGMLEGCWQLDSDYTILHEGTGRLRTVTEWRLCLDANGAGEQTLAFDDGTQCSGPTQGSFDDQGQLVLTDTARITCDDGMYIYERVATCQRSPDGTAACDSVQPGRDTGSPVRLRR
jgi:hypothetical protein